MPLSARQKVLLHHLVTPSTPLLQFQLEREICERVLEVHVVGLLGLGFRFRVPAAPKSEHLVPSQQLDVEQLS